MRNNTETGSERVGRFEPVFKGIKRALLSRTVGVEEITGNLESMISGANLKSLPEYQPAVNEGTEDAVRAYADAVIERYKSLIGRGKVVETV